MKKSNLITSVILAASMLSSCSLTSDEESKGKFDPSNNVNSCIYGPPHIEYTLECKECDYESIEHAKDIDDKKIPDICPNCGKKDTIEEKKSSENEDENTSDNNSDITEEESNDKSDTEKNHNAKTTN